MLNDSLPASEPRELLRRLCEERGDDFASLSRLLGRNPAYVQQFIRRGTPRRLPEKERRLLARHFGIAEHLLGGEADVGTAAGLLPIAGLGGETGPRMALDPVIVARLTDSPAEALALVAVGGDSMAPTILPDDDVLVDRADGAARARDGLYLLRVDDRLLVRRLTLHPIHRQVTVQSDNPSYADWPGLTLEEIDLVGRIVWAGRRFA